MIKYVIKPNLASDVLQRRFAENFYGAIVHFQRIVERYFIIGQAEILTALLAFAHLLCEFNQFRDDLGRLNGPVLIFTECRFQHFGEGAGLDEAAEIDSVLSPRGVHKHFPNWRNYREYSGGMMTDWGAHHFDIAQWGLGMDESGPVEIIPPDDPKATKGVRYIYANGVEVIHGDGGGVTFIGTAGKIFVNRGKFKAEPESIAQDPIPDNGIHLYKSTNHLQDFLSCMRSRKRPICDVEIGCRSVTVCHLGNLAYWNHRRLKWDPAKEQFIGDKEANFWIDRPVRGPWKV